jgi:hypothetical protein
VIKRLKCNKEKQCMQHVPIRSAKMNRMKQYIALIATMTMLGASAQSLDAAVYCTDAGGCGYEECRTAPCLAPAIALGTIALAAIVAVVVQNSHGGNGHCHAHN